MIQTHLRSIILVTSIFIICACEPSQEIFPDWHQWMGPQRDGSWVTDLDMDTLKPGDLRKVWETEIGSDLLLRLPVPDSMGLLDWKCGRAQEERCYQFVTRLIEEAGGPEPLIESAAQAN